MSGVIVTNPKVQFLGANGAPLVGGTLTTYLAGTTTPTATYQDEALTAANTNPIVLDARGECLLWLDSTKNYKFVLANSSGVVQWTVDDISGPINDALLRSILGAANGASLIGYTGPAPTSAVTTLDKLADSGPNLGGDLIGYVQAGAESLPPPLDTRRTATVQAKLRETVSVKDFGAVGDGVTDDTAAIQAAIDYINNVAGANFTTPRTVIALHIPAGQYLITSPLLLYQKDGIRIYGDGPMNTQFIVGSNMASVTYPAAWQALAEYATLQANPAVFQIARRRVTGVGNPGAGGVNLANTGYSQAGAVAAAWFYIIEGVGFFARNTYPKAVHGIFSVEVAQAKFADIYAEGMDHAIWLQGSYSTKIDQIKVFDSVAPVKVQGGTSLEVSNCGASWCDEGYTLTNMLYSFYSNMGCDYWGVGSYAYDISGMSIHGSGLGSERGLGGILKCRDSNSRGGIHFSGCNFVGGVSEGDLNDTGQTTIGDFGVPAMLDFEGHYITFTECAFRSEIFRSGVGTYFGARAFYKTKIVLNLPSDPITYGPQQRNLFNTYLTVVGSTAIGWPSVMFTSDLDRNWGTVYLSTAQSIGSDVTYTVPFDTLLEGDINNQFNLATGELTVKAGGVYEFDFGGVLSGDAYNGYFGIQVLNRPAGLSNVLLTEVPSLATTNTERSVSQSIKVRLVPGDKVRVIVRRLTTANPGSIFAYAQLTWSQIA